MKYLFLFFAVLTAALGAPENPALAELKKLEPFLNDIENTDGVLREQTKILALKVPQLKTIFAKVFKEGASFDGIEIDFIAQFHMVDHPDRWDVERAQQSHKELLAILAGRPYEIVAFEGGFGKVLDEPLPLYSYAMQPFTQPMYLQEKVDLSSLEAFTRTLDRASKSAMWKDLPFYDARDGLYMGADDIVLSAVQQMLVMVLPNSKAALQKMQAYDMYALTEESVSRLRSYHALTVTIAKMQIYHKKKGAIVFGARHCLDLERMAKAYGICYKVVDTAGSYEFMMKNFGESDRKF